MSRPRSGVCLWDRREQPCYENDTPRLKIEPDLIRSSPDLTVNKNSLGLDQLQSFFNVAMKKFLSEQRRADREVRQAKEEYMPDVDMESTTFRITWI